MTDTRTQPGSPGPGSSSPGFWGKYRATVIDNIDLTGLGKLLCGIPTFPEMLLNWALPCIPYAGPLEGFWAIPPIGANVWLEFENGDPSYPVWTGCFWELGEVPLAIELAPEDPALVKVFRSEFCTVMLNDTPGEGGITLSVIDPVVEVPVTLLMNALGLEINCGPMTLLMNPEVGITISAGETVTVLTEATITSESPTITMTADDVNVTAVVTIEGDVNATGAVEVEGDTSITGAFTVDGAVDITGAVEIAPVLNVTGELSVEGDHNVLGELSVEGDHNVLGELSVEGDANILGAGQVEGNWAVAGLIEGIVVPPLL